MTRTKAIAVSVVAGSVVVAASDCRAGFILGDAANYAVLFEGAGANHLSFNNGTVTGNIGIGAPSGSTTSQLQLSGGAANTIIDGNVNFTGTTNVSGTAGTDYTITAGHSITGGNANVQTDLNNLNSLSSTLGAEAGTSLAISIANGANQTVSASSGILDGSGNRVFTVTSQSFVNGATLTINGSASDFVVFNYNADVSFGGTIVLTGGITSDQVLFNVIGGSGLSGGHTLTISTNGATERGTFLDPNGTIQMNHSFLAGRLFGGDTHDEQIVSGASITAPVPAPGAAVLLAAGLIAALRRRR
jgi:MYXO-CTERM domain-containing protein